MKTGTIRIILFFIFCAYSIMEGSAQDSIATTQLDEVVVEGERGWIEGNAVNYVPTRKEKRLSDSPASLIKAMHLPMLKAMDGQIVNSNGNPVTIFINGQRANDIDISAFWPKDVKKVQYIENSRDPLYEGVQYAVNFVTARYVVGGVSKVRLFQRFPTRGVYNLSSKMTYKKMTFGMNAQYIYSRDHHTSTEAETEYRDIYLNDNFHNLIERYQKEKSVERSNYVTGAFNARYATSKFLATHTLSLTYKQNPNSNSTSDDLWSDDLFDSSTSWNSEKSKSISPYVSGNYVYVFSRKWYITGQWAYAYSDNHLQNWNQLGDTGVIYNNYKESVNALNFSVVPTYLYSQKLSFQLLLSSSLKWFGSHYQGSVFTDNDIATRDLNSSIKIYWIPSNKIYFTLEPGLTGTFKKVGDVTNNSVIPTFKAYANLNLTRKFNMGLNVNHYSSTASASESNPVMVKASEMMWIMGNPSLKNGRFWDVSLSANHIPSNWFSMSYGFVYHHANNGVISTYMAAPQADGGIIQRMENAGPMDYLFGKVSFQFSLLDNDLSFGVSPKWSYNHFREGHFRSFNWLYLSADIDYTIRNFQFSVEYEGPHKDIDYNGMQKSWSQDQLDASVVFGTDNIRIEGRIYNIFNRHAKSKTEFISPNYITRFTKREIGREVSISLTYTFGYGKKIDPQINIESPAETESSILKIR